MSKRIMLHFPLEKFYPLAILFEDAIILGAENDTILFNASSISTTNLPYCTLERSVSTISTFLIFCFCYKLIIFSWTIYFTSFIADIHTYKLQNNQIEKNEDIDYLHYLNWTQFLNFSLNTFTILVDSSLNGMPKT